MNDTVRLSQAPPNRTSMNYAALRESGLELIRQLTKETWTDHNIHDPGITLLEAFSYAMTELGFRLQLDIRDLLRSGERFALPNLLPVHRVLPSAPVTLDDLHKVLLDHPLVNEAWIAFQSNPEVSFYLYNPDERVEGNPPFSFDPNTAEGQPRSSVKLQGLYEVMLNFEQYDWNSNTYSPELIVDELENPLKLEIALPHWDEVQATPFRTGARINSVTMVDLGSGVWRALSEPQSYFGTLQVNYTDTAGSATIDLWILLRIPGEQSGSIIRSLLEAAQNEIEATVPGRLMMQFRDRVQTAYRGVLQLQRYIESWRNLCEYPIRLKVARRQEIALRARIEVTGGTDLEQLLAEIFFEIDLALSPSMQFASLADMQSQGKTVEALYDGPLLQHGFLQVEKGSLIHNNKIFTSDILRTIMRLRGADGSDVVAQENSAGRDIIAVTDLAISNFINNRSITIDAQNCLNLVESDRYRPYLSVLKSRITFIRDDVEVRYNLERVNTLFEKLQSQYRASTELKQFSPIWPVTPGDKFPIDDYFAFQNDLPRIYGVGEAGVSAGEQIIGQARTLQTQGYLLLFEQFLADLTAQIGSINRFFSANPDEQATYFTRALLELPGMEKLLNPFPSGGNGLSDGLDENPYHLTLQQAIESREQFLDRRNRMLDHLLARQGEAMVSWSQELHRWAQQNLEAMLAEAAAVPTSDYRDKLRQAVNARLIRDKARFLAAAPDLNLGKLQAFGHPLRSHPEWLQINAVASGFRWVLVINDEPLLQSANQLPSRAAALINAEEAMLLAAQSNFYQIVGEGEGRFRLSLRDGAEGISQLVGESVETWITEDATGTALNAIISTFFRIRLETSITPLEQRIAHLIGIRKQTHRRLIASIDQFFEIYRGVDDDVTERQWRLWQLPGYDGTILLESDGSLRGSEAEPTEQGAIKQARKSILSVIRQGLDEWNYQTVSPPGNNRYNFELLHPKGDRLAVHHPSFSSQIEAQSVINTVIEHLYTHYSGEGFYLVEHLLLRPRQPDDSFLSLPMSESEKEHDPYSQRLSLVFPSGYARDFSLLPGTVEPEKVSPHRFRDLEFRNYVERIVEQSCPAHLWPKIYWCDRHIPQNPDSPTFKLIPGCFDHFEQVYFNWLETQLIPGVDETAAHAARNALIRSLNEVSQP